MGTGHRVAEVGTRGRYGKASQVTRVVGPTTRAVMTQEIRVIVCALGCVTTHELPGRLRLCTRRAVPLYNAGMVFFNNEK